MHRTCSNLTNSCDDACSFAAAPHSADLCQRPFSLLSSGTFSAYMVCLSISPTVSLATANLIVPTAHAIFCCKGSWLYLSDFCCYWCVQMRSSQVFVHDASLVTPFQLLLFGGRDMTLEFGQRVLVVDKWMRFNMVICYFTSMHDDHDSLQTFHSSDNTSVLFGHLLRIILCSASMSHLPPAMLLHSVSHLGLPGTGGSIAFQKTKSGC